MKVCAMHALVFAIQRLLAMLFRLADNSLNVLLPLLIEISNSIASSYSIYSGVSLELSSIPAKLCNAKFATVSRSCMDELGIFGMASPLCTSLMAFRNHSYFQKFSPKMMHMLSRIRHVATKSCTFFKCTSILFKRIRHLPFSMPNARLTHIRGELCT